MARIINTADLLTEDDISALDHNAREWVYNGLDCCVTYEIRDQLVTLLDPITTKTYAFSRALQAPILEMSMRGVLVDQQRRTQVLNILREKIDRLESQLTEIVREGIGFTNTENTKTARWWRSHPRVKNLLYDVMGLPPIKTRSKATGLYTPSDDRDALETLRDKYFIAEPIVTHLLALRDLDKKRGFLETEVDRDGRMRSNFNIAGTNTGRLSSSFSDFGTGTNLQNVDRELRSVFVADRGYKLANLDLEQGDARNVGAICWNLFADDDESYAGSYLNACESGDLHTYNSRLIWPDKAWTGDLAADKALAEEIFYRQDSFRQMSKKGGHGTNFFGTPRTMAKHLKVPTALIENFQRAYFAAYPVIGTFDPKRSDPQHERPTWHNWVWKQLQDKHSLTTLMGRRRQFFGRAFDDSTLREAIAYEPQSLTADFIDTGILSLWRANRVQLLIQVHDSILLQYPEEEENEILPWALEALKTRLLLRKGREFVVPTEAKVGWNWGEWDEEKNPDGLIKWKGSDTRKRVGEPWLRRLSIFDL